MRFDLLIRGGRVIDPGSGRDEIADVAVSAGSIVAVGRDLPSSDAFRVIDAHGKLVTPGLIDLHTHIFPKATFWGIDHRQYAPTSGVTTWIDAGSAGAFNIGAFAEMVGDRGNPPVRAFINISSIGLTARFGELANLDYCDEALCARLAELYNGLVVGVKVRASYPILLQSGLEAVRRARAAANAVGLPLMMHVGGGPPALEPLVSLLGEGDIITHCATPQDHRLVTESGKLRDCVAAALDRGVLLDVGHGNSSFSFAVAESLLRCNAMPYTISTDVHQVTVRREMWDMPACLSKFLALGMPLYDVIAAATINPATAAGLSHISGTLAVGRRADIAVFDLEEGAWEMPDVELALRRATTRLRCIETISGGETLTADGFNYTAPWIESAEPPSTASRAIQVD